MSGGALEGIAIARTKGGPMETLTAATVEPARGLLGDARGAFPRRQITLLFREGWEEACAALGRTLPWTTRRANLLVGGLAVPRMPGTLVRIGPVVLRVTEETAPCNLMEKQAPGLRRALIPDFRGGVCTDVVAGGSIAVGDPVDLGGA